LQQFVDPARSRGDLKARFGYFSDLARWVQDELEQALLFLIRERLSRHSSPNLAYAGGVALNAVANSRILRETSLQRLYVQPAAGDSGLAVGCAYYGWLEVLGRGRVPAPPSVHLGRGYDTGRIKSALTAVGDSAVRDDPIDVIDRVAELLADHKVVGWFRGGAEFGPRALGHRSILAHPGWPGLRDHINANIKFREDFRPFAPSVLLADATRFFDCGEHDSPYMILVFPVRPEWRDALSNVVHEDGSARLQTVTSELDPVYHRLLTAFGRRTGLPVLLNTSLNKRGMPIVETPEEAVTLFLEGALDALVLEDVLLIKTSAGAVDRRRRRGPVDEPGLDQVPLLGSRIARVSLHHDLPARTRRGLTSSRPRVVLEFTDGAEPLDVAPDTFDFLVACDGVRRYRDIAADLNADPATVLELARVLSRGGIVDRLEQSETNGAWSSADEVVPSASSAIVDAPVAADPV